MALVRFSNQYPSLFDRFFENDFSTGRTAIIQTQILLYLL